MLSFELLEAIPTDFSYRKHNLLSITVLIMGLKKALPTEAENRAPAITFSQALPKSAAQSQILAVTDVIFTTLPSSDT